MPITYVQLTNPGTDCTNSTMANKLQTDAINKISFFTLQHPTAQGYDDFTQCFQSDGTISNMCTLSNSSVDNANLTYFTTCFADKYDYDVNPNDITIKSNNIFACEITLDSGSDYYGVNVEKLNDASEQANWDAFEAWARRSEYNGKTMRCGILQSNASNLIPLDNYTTELVNHLQKNGVLDKNGIKSFKYNQTKQELIFQKTNFIQQDGTIISQQQTKPIVGYSKLS